jgi:hypothetical protein
MGSINENRTPQGLKPSNFQLFTARLKPCPDTKPESIYSTNFRDITLVPRGAGSLAGRPSGPKEQMGFLLRFFHAGTNEALALPALNPDFLYAALDATAYAAFVKESRKRRAGAT